MSKLNNKQWVENRVAAAKHCIETINDDAEERAWSWIYDEMIRFREALESISEMKIPYCDGYDIACSMRDEARSCLGDNHE